MKRLTNGYILGNELGYVRGIDGGTSGHCSPSIAYTNNASDAELYLTQASAQYDKDYFQLTLYKVRILEEVTKVK